MKCFKCGKEGADTYTPLCAVCTGAKPPFDDLPNMTVGELVQKLIAFPRDALVGIESWHYTCGKYWVTPIVKKEGEVVSIGYIEQS